MIGYALERLGDVPGVTIYGPRTAEQRGGVVAFTVDGIHPHDLGPDRWTTMASPFGPATTAARCSRTTLDVPGTARASFYVYNTPEEVDALVAAVEAARDIFATEVVDRCRSMTCTKR